ncbi:DinB family protein [Nibribacter ruber]|uniref:DinB family protein n=1 Tax=Nibribacter ruber TaxID=2698458 RepID=A0A6P1P0J9_9BACT|nr:DinB family protein [Nibribacter ruber]QHL87851.1 DinB family protein [Nibribacter ruber]
METHTFITQLQDRVQHVKATVQSEFLPLDAAALNFKPQPASWSILECLEHLNRYSRFYLPAFEKAIAQVPAAGSDEVVKYSWFGKKSLEMVNPASAKKHKTLQRMNPHNSQLSKAVLDEFLQHQDRLLQLLSRAATVDLNKKALPVEFFPLLKLRLGEALEFVVLHEQRHLQQALRVKASASQPLSLVV